jgi:signal transduction histidine kinase
VKDSGVGIRPEELTRIFERFYQADTSTTPAIRGHRIGLSLARELVELHGGEIKAESTPGTGSTFTVTLPLDTSIICR